MTSEKTLRIEQTEKGQQEMQEKTARMTKVVMNLTKGKGITEGPSLQKEPTSWRMAAIHLLCQIGMTFLNENN